jgi:hypothetical protein
MSDQTIQMIRNTGVPYYSQWGSPDFVRAIVEDNADPCDDPAWQRGGFTDPERYRFWAKRLCGLTCLESALDFWKIGMYRARACWTKRSSMMSTGCAATAVSTA